jgi:hypothetical protein
MGLGLLGDSRASRANLALDSCNRLARDFTRGARDAGDGGSARFTPQFLYARCHAALVVAGLFQVLLKALLVGSLVGKGNVCRQIGL